MRRLRLVGLVAVLAVTAEGPAAAAAKKNKKEQEPVTQTLELPKDPPQAVVADAARLQFNVSALSARGLLSQQVRDALRDIQRQLRGATAVKLRAYVAGSGDLRRVQAIVSETFTERRQPIPALSVIQVGAFPLTGAQVVIEATSAARKDVNPHGVAFISGQLERDKDPTAPVGALATRALANVGVAARAAGSGSADVLRVTCYLSTLADVNDVRARIASAYPSAVMNVMQVQRAPLGGLVECEAVARLRAAPGAPLRMLNPEQLPKSEFYSQVAVVGPVKLAISGTQMAFGYQDQDLRLAFQRLGKAMESVGASLSDVAFSFIYPLSQRMSEQIRTVRFEFYDKSRPPASTMLAFEGLPSLDASMAVDVIAVR